MKLSHDQLEELVRDAGAVERSPVAGPSAVATRPWRRLLVGLGAIAAVVAVVAGAVLAVLGLPAGTAGPAHAGGTGAGASARVGEETRSVLLAVFQDQGGRVACVNWSAQHLEGRSLTQISTDELARAGLSMSCDPGASRLLVVGLYGPRRLLPDSDERARAVARCFSQSEPCGPGAFDASVCASAGCLDSSVQVRITSLALK